MLVLVEEMSCASNEVSLWGVVWAQEKAHRNGSSDRVAFQ